MSRSGWRRRSTLLAGGRGRWRARGGVCSPTRPPTFTLVSPLADGADQIAAEVALERGCRAPGGAAVQPRQPISATFPDSAQRARFDALLGQAECVLELPGDAATRLDAYVMAGRATVAHCDLLIAVWDGLPPRGRGGTAEIVAAGARPGHADHPYADRPGGAGDHPVGGLRPDGAHAHRSTSRRPADRSRPRRSARTAGGTARAAARPERARVPRAVPRRAERGACAARIEYPLLLAFAGTRRFDSRRNGASRECAAAIRDEWIGYRAALRRPPWRVGVARPARARLWLERPARGPFRPDLPQRPCVQFRARRERRVARPGRAGRSPARSWSWRSANSSSRWRSSSTPVRDQPRMAPALARLSPAGRAIAADAQLEIARHRRPDPPGSAANPVARRWIDWYAAGVWRAMGCPDGTDRPGRARRWRRRSPPRNRAADRIPRASARQVDALDHRLEVRRHRSVRADAGRDVGLVIAGLIDRARVGRAHANWFTLLSAGLPAVGTAIFGIRFQGDFGGSAVRSQSTADLLRTDRSASWRSMRAPTCRARPISSNKRRGQCSRTSTNGGWSTNSMSSRSADDDRPGKDIAPPARAFGGRSQGASSVEDSSNPPCF